MASLWTVIVLCLIHCAFAEICPNLGAIKNCDECVRCGAVWCKTPVDGVRCADPSDDWCQDKMNTFPIETASSSGNAITPKFEERSIFIGRSSEIIIDYLVQSPVSLPKVEVDVVESTVKGFRDELEYSGHLDVNLCKGTVSDYCVKVKVMPKIGFCPVNGTADEQVTLSINIEGIQEVATARLHVSCSCACIVEEKDSMKCNAHGDYTNCGSCACHHGWDGEFCENKIARVPSIPNGGVKLPPVKGPALPDIPVPNFSFYDTECHERGDISCRHPLTGLLCSENGRCCDGKCQCDQRLPGYLDFDEYCADMCMASSECDACILQPVVGEKCSHCHFPLIMDAPDKSVIQSSIQYSWSMCNVTAEGCFIDYAVMRDKNRDMHVMVFNSNCGETAPFVYRVTVPVVVSLLAVIALLSVAAFMVYKNRLPGMPTSEPQYADIHAEDSTGINPLYKPPTSSFKNPTYGSKW